MTFSPTEAIRHGADHLEVAVDQAQAERLAALIEGVMRVNARINVIGPCSLEEAVERHLLDSLALLRLADRKPELESWIDVGTGAGFPGLVWAIMRPKMNLLLVDSIGKKIALVRKHTLDLGLSNVKVLPARFEALPEPSEPMGLVSRATFAPSEWLSRARGFLTKGGAVVATMGGQPDPELLTDAMCIERLSLPPSGLERTNGLWEVRG